MAKQSELKRLAKFTNESGAAFDVWEHGKVIWKFAPVGGGDPLYVHFDNLKTDAREALAAGRDFDARERPEFKRRQALDALPPE